MAVMTATLLCTPAFAEDALTGKKIVVDYETGYLFQVEYLSDNRLKWTSLKERTDGGPMTGEETYYSYQIREGLYNVNWIEATGIAVSQILDFTGGKVYAFMTWKDDTSRGKRAHYKRGLHTQGSNENRRLHPG